MASAEGSKTLEFTATWVVALVCSVIVIVSLLAERFLHYLGKFLKNEHQDALFQALEKLKEELMLLGFISLLLTVSQSFINDICIPESASFHMLPCIKEESAPVEVVHKFSSKITRKRIRLLSEEAASDHCTRQGKIQLLSLEALHQLHIFIFVLAVVHVVFSATTMVLGGARIRQWKHWEKEIHREISTPEKSLRADHLRPSHHMFLQERAAGFWRKSAVVSRMMSFFKQFYGPLTKSDYKALRAGFIMRHCPAHLKFDFNKYMMRALEDDFQKVVGISWYLWLFVIVFLLINIHGWHPYFWLSFLPLILVLIVGAKLEHIITRLAIKLAEAHTDGQGRRVKPSDEHFWFKRPNFVLYLIHFILFQNSFEIAFLFWMICTYGFHSCILEGVGFIIPRLVVGVTVEVLCSYSTFPLYAIVTQMGDSYKQAIFAQHMQSTLHGWVAGVRKRKRPASALPSSVLELFLGKRKKEQQESSGVAEIQMQRAVRGEDSSGPLQTWQPDLSPGFPPLETEASSQIETPKLVINNIDVLRRAVVTDGSTVPAAMYHDSFIWRVVEMGVNDRCLPVFFATSDSYYSYDAFMDFGFRDLFIFRETFGWTRDQAKLHMVHDFFSQDQLKVIDEVLGPNPRHLSELYALKQADSFQQSENLSDFEDIVDAYLAFLQVNEVNPAMESALAILQKFASDARCGKIPKERMHFGVPWRHPPPSEDSASSSKWAKIQLMDFVQSLVDAEFGVNYLTDRSCEILEDPALIAMIEVGLLYQQRDPSFIRPITVGIQRCIVRWLVQERMQMRLQDYMSFMWQRIIRGRSYRHLMKEVGYKYK